MNTIFALVLTLAAAQRPNVLFIAVDDLRPDLGCYGNPIVKSPNIDALAKSGVRFDRAYTQFPLCNPSRTSMLTGRYVSTTKITGNREIFSAHLPGVVTLPAYFKANGYATARTGKIFHGGLDDTGAWGEGGEPVKTEAQMNADKATNQPAAQKRFNYTAERPFAAVPGEGEELGDYKTATRAVALLEKHKDHPFFLAVGFLKPHTPYIAPKKYFDLYKDRSRIPMPPDFAPHVTLGPGVPKRALPPKSSDLFSTTEVKPEDAREAIAAYYAAASFTDAQVGRVMEALDRLGLRKNTIVVLFGDHGYHLGEKGKWSKHGSLYEVGTRVPMLIAAPGARGNGKVSNRMAELVDLYPTLADLAGLPMPAGLQGQSLKPLLDDPAAKWDHPAYTIAGNLLGFSVRTDGWRYTEWKGPDGGAELYDEKADPHEMKNLASDTKYAAKVKEMTKLLHAAP